MSGRDGEREKKSFSELDRLRRERRSGAEPEPRSPAQRERSEAATKQYLKSMDRLFAGGAGGAEVERLARAMRDAHGTPGLAEACRAYREALGVPPDTTLLSLFLDCGDRELVHGALERLRACSAAGELEISRGLRSQLRVLAQGSDDEAAEAAEELLDSESRGPDGNS